MLHCLCCKYFCFDGDVVGFESLAKTLKKAGRKAMRSYMPGLRKDPETGKLIWSEVTDEEREAAQACFNEAVDIAEDLTGQQLRID